MEIVPGEKAPLSSEENIMSGTPPVINTFLTDADE